MRPLLIFASTILLVIIILAGIIVTMGRNVDENQGDDDSGIDNGSGDGPLNEDNETGVPEIKYTEDMLDLSFQNSKSNYGVNESIKIELELTNMHNTSLVVLPLYGEFIDIILSYPSGERSLYVFSDTDSRGMGATRENHYLVSLDSNDVSSLELPVSNMFDINATGSYGLEIVYDATDPGEITLSYWNLRKVAIIEFEVVDG